jgi:serine/threonine-protein kinase
MHQTLVVDKETPTTSAAAPEAGPITLPPFLLAEASRRLGWAGLIYGMTYLIAYWVPYGITLLSGQPNRHYLLPDVVALISIAMGFAVFVLSRRARKSAESLLDFGLVFGVLGSLGISVAEFWRGLPARDWMASYMGIPWECIWILIFPVVAPNTPGKILISSLAAASTAPATVLVATSIARVAPPPEPLHFVLYFGFTTYVAAVLAFIVAKIVYRYGVRLKKAQEVGSYELLMRLGQGGMGEVWVARHRMLARPAAVKLIRPELLGADQQGRETMTKRFEREARDTAALGSAHTVDIYDFGVTPDGAFYYVMELLDGLSFDRLIAQFGPIEPHRAVYLLKQVCHSLGEAHDRGLIHRDIKPANLFTCRLGPDFDFVKVLDFGLVKHGADHPAATELTMAGHTSGTPAYMAPEMALGKADIDGRADLYALGCVAYFLLTGHQVFTGETPVATILQHVRETPVPPSSRTEIRIPAGLEALILSCLAKNPADRPSCASELSARLSASIPNDPWTRHDAREWWERHQPARRV